MIKEVKSYAMFCDNCNELYSEPCSDYTMWVDENGARESSAEEGWIEHNGKHYCPDCYELDDDDNIIIKEIKEKKMTKDLNKLAKEIYEANKAKGFHEVKHSEEHMLCLVISELMEAVEADRIGERANLEIFDGHNGSNLEGKEYSDCFYWNIKDCVEDELADAVIRLLDTAKSLGVNPDSLSGHRKNCSFNSNLFTECVFEIVVSLTSVGAVEHNISYSIIQIETLCKNLNIDLWKHVELKLKYNSLRPYMHGKKY